MDLQTLYQNAIRFAAGKHSQQGQTIPGTSLPYVVHLSNVAMEILVAYADAPVFDVALAVQLALLHDTLEDTTTQPEELIRTFGRPVAEGVQALTKDNTLPKEERMPDSLKRIKALPKEVWAVKLADRITNLQSPPGYWKPAKKVAYQSEARVILEQLKDGNEYLARRLEKKIYEYSNYVAQ